MKKIFWVVSVVIAAASLWLSCKKKDETPVAVPCSAGKGGSVTIVAYAQHGGVNIINSTTHLDTAYIKFNATIIPGYTPANYDTFYVGEPGEDHIHCAELKCGNYFLYRTAFDTTTMTRFSGTKIVNLAQSSGEADVIVVVN